MLTSSKIVVIGQSKIIKKINSFNLDTFPHSLLLIAPKGAGKHLISKYISEYLDVEYRELDNKIKSEDIEDIIFNPNPTLYLIDLDNAEPKLQNNLLKIIEEPMAGVFIIGVSSNSNLIIPTLLNRCQKWYFETYKKEDLGTFITFEHINIKDTILDIFTTPGQIMAYQSHPIVEIQTLTNIFLDRLQTATIPALLSIVDRLAFKNEKDKYNVDVFIKILNNSALKRVMTNKEHIWVNVFKVLSTLEYKTNLRGVSKQKVLEECIIQLKQQC